MLIIYNDLGARLSLFSEKASLRPKHLANLKQEFKWLKRIYMIGFNTKIINLSEYI